EKASNNLCSINSIGVHPFSFENKHYNNILNFTTMTTLITICIICIIIFLGLKVIDILGSFISKNATILAIILIGVVLYAIL
ncbi:hypothetical protein, partial [Sharpea azabuensis]|uniref:hypothetical protein n=1 Tax=Sharpea azabuensis TaxID=322505 RepID=UPI002E8080AB